MHRPRFAVNSTTRVLIYSCSSKKNIIAQVLPSHVVPTLWKAIDKTQENEMQQGIQRNLISFVKTM
jgi:hypothetical protein